MTLITILNIVGCVGVILAVVTPLIWAIRTQQRNEPPAAPARRMARPPLQPRPTRDPRGRRPAPHPAYETS